MKAAQLEVGKWYKINYRKSLNKKRARSWNGYAYDYGFEEKPQEGVGQLIKLKAKNGQHLFEVDGESVYATSQGVLKETKAQAAVGKGCMLDPKFQRDLEKLRKLGLDDESRAREIDLVKTFLFDLGVEIHPDKENTHATIDYLSLVNLKFLAMNLLKTSMETDYGDLVH
jgi:hypothetical protein